MPSRFAIYFVPPPGSRLAQFGSSILGYDCECGSPVPRIRLPGIADHEALQMTHAPSRYGFHATLKAPFRACAGRSEADLRTALERFCNGRRPVSLGRLTVEPIGAFFALRPVVNFKSIGDLAADCLMSFDEFRSPPSADEIGRRRAAGLTARQEVMLERWGYPYVLDEYRFHLTLAGPLPEARREIWRKALSDAFRALAGEEWTIDALVLVRQDEPKSPFRVVCRAGLAG